MTDTKVKALDTKSVKNQYDMLDDVTKAYVMSILQAMTSTLQAIYYISIAKPKNERNNFYE